MSFTLMLAPVDLDAAVVGMETVVATTEASTIGLDPVVTREGNVGYGVGYQEVVPGPMGRILQRSWFVRVDALGSVLQATQLDEATFSSSGSPFFLRYAGDHYLVGYRAPTAYVLDTLVCDE